MLQKYIPFAFLVLIGGCSLLEKLQEGQAESKQQTSSGAKLSSYAELLEPFARSARLERDVASLRLFAAIKSPGQPTAYVLSPLLMDTLHAPYFLEDFIGNLRLNTVSTVEMYDYRDIPIFFGSAEENESTSLTHDQKALDELLARNKSRTYFGKSTTLQIASMYYIYEEDDDVTPENMALTACYDDIKMKLLDNVYQVIAIIREGADGIDEFYIPIDLIQTEQKNRYPERLRTSFLSTLSRLQNIKVLPGDTLELLTSEEFQSRMRERYEAKPQRRR